MRRALVLVVLWLSVLPVEPVRADAGPWGWPLAGAHEVARPFAAPASTYGSGHRGADVPSTVGAPVRASATGRVTYAGLLAGRGVVVVTHGALRTTYEPVTASVSVGATVALGDVVGRLDAGHLGCPVAACLHWGLRRGEQYLDPVRLVERGPVRLLPMDAVGGSAHAGSTSAALAAEGRTATGASAPARPPAASRGSGPPATEREPSWSLRADEAPLGAAAVAALVVGIGLLTRPRPPAPRPGPPAVPLAAGAPVPVEAPPVPVDDGLRRVAPSRFAASAASLGAAAAGAATAAVEPPGAAPPGAAEAGATPPVALESRARRAAAVAPGAAPPTAPGRPPVATSDGPPCAIARVLDLTAERERRRPA